MKRQIKVPPTLEQHLLLVPFLSATGGYQGPEKQVKYKKWNIAAVIALLIFAGSIMGLPTGFVFVGIGGICFFGGSYLGARQYKRTHGQ